MEISKTVSETEMNLVMSVLKRLFANQGILSKGGKVVGKIGSAVGIKIKPKPVLFSENWEFGLICMAGIGAAFAVALGLKELMFLVAS